MARTYGPGGEMKKRKKGEPFNSKSQTNSRMASLYYKSGEDRMFPSEGPGSLLDRNLKDYDKPMKGYPSDREFPSGTFPLAKKKKKSKKRKA